MLCLEVLGFVVVPLWRKSWTVGDPSDPQCAHTRLSDFLSFHSFALFQVWVDDSPTQRRVWNQNRLMLLLLFCLFFYVRGKNVYDLMSNFSPDLSLKHVLSSKLMQKVEKKNLKCLLCSNIWTACLWLFMIFFFLFSMTLFIHGISAVYSRPLQSLWCSSSMHAIYVGIFPERTFWLCEEGNPSSLVLK